MDDDLDKSQILLVKMTADNEFSRLSGGAVEELPAIVLFENGVPKVFDGDETREQSILEWLKNEAADDTDEESEDRVGSKKRVRRIETPRRTKDELDPEGRRMGKERENVKKEANKVDRKAKNKENKIETSKKAHSKQSIEEKVKSKVKEHIIEEVKVKGKEKDEDVSDHDHTNEQEDGVKDKVTHAPNVMKASVDPKPKVQPTPQSSRKKPVDVKPNAKSLDEKAKDQARQRQKQIAPPKKDLKPKKTLAKEAIASKRRKIVPTPSVETSNVGKNDAIKVPIRKKVSTVMHKENVVDTKSPPQIKKHKATQSDKADGQEEDYLNDEALETSSIKAKKTKSTTVIRSAKQTAQHAKKEKPTIVRKRVVSEDDEMDPNYENEIEEPTDTNGAKEQHVTEDDDDDDVTDVEEEEIAELPPTEKRRRTRRVINTHQQQQVEKETLDDVDYDVQHLEEDDKDDETVADHDYEDDQDEHDEDAAAPDGDEDLEEIFRPSFQHNDEEEEEDPVHIIDESPNVVAFFCKSPTIAYLLSH